MRYLIWSAVLLASCAFDTSGLIVPDGQLDSRIVLADAALETRTDLLASDASALDLPASDLPASDLPVPDLPVPDLPVPDLPVPDLPVPDLPVPDLPVPDLPVPDLPVPDLPVPDLPVPDTGPETGTPWDVSAVFIQTDFNFYPVEIFGQEVNDNQTIHASFDGTSDSTYTEPLHDCSGFYTDQPKARTWDIERKRVDANTYRILIRGQSDGDCGQGTPHCEGSVQLHAASAWSITQIVKCSATLSCTVDMGLGTISWHSGPACGTCCACPDAAGVDIEVVVTRP